jgi:CRP-like cAMP-binding protein
MTDFVSKDFLTATARNNSVAFSRNRLISHLPEKELRRLRPLFERVKISPRQVLHHWNTPMEHVYFVEEGLVSVLAKIGAQKWVEVWLVGSDGMTGIPVLLGDPFPTHRRVVQIGGTALRISRTSFERALSESEDLRLILLKYLQFVLIQTSQSGACSAHHTTLQQLARWLLVAQQALQSDQFSLSHDVLARLIGVRRATVSVGLANIARTGAIQTSRGLIGIKSAERLEAVGCDCYRIIRRERKRLLGW